MTPDGVLLADEQENGYGNADAGETETVILNGRPLKVKEVIRIILDNNVDASSLMYEAVMSDSAYRKLQNKYKLDINAYGSYYDTHSERFSVAKDLGTGTYVEIGAMNGNYSSQFFQGGPIALSEQVDNRFYGFLTIRQDLLKNAFGINDREQMEILKVSAESDRILIIDRITELTASAIYGCWDLAMKAASMKNAEEQLNSIKQVRDIIATNLEYGLAESYDLNQYNAAVLLAESSYNTVKKEYDKAAKALLREMNLKGENNIEGSVSISADKYKIGEKTVLEKIYNKRNDYQNALAAVEIAKKKVNMYGNGGLPSLTASYMAKTDRINNAPEWGAEISLNLPIGETDNSTNLRNSEMELKEAKDKLELKKIEVRDDVENATDGIETADYALKKTKEAKLQTELYYKRMFVRFKQGKLNAATLKTGLDNLISARQQELSVYVDYNMAILKYQVAINDVFESNRININEYINKFVKE
jgi:hypothetical protein